VVALANAGCGVGVAADDGKSVDAVPVGLFGSRLNDGVVLVSA
jgi:hypothetical protein